MSNLLLQSAAICALAFGADEGAVETSVVANDAENKIEFAVPVRLTAAGALVKVEAPGYAAPCLADVDEDGLKDLVVGQFSGGKMRVYRNLGDGKYGAGDWLKVDGAPAEVPGVW